MHIYTADFRGQQQVLNFVDTVTCLALHIGSSPSLCICKGRGIVKFIIEDKNCSKTLIDGFAPLYLLYKHCIPLMQNMSEKPWKCSAGMSAHMTRDRDQ